MGSVSLTASIATMLSLGGNSLPRLTSGLFYPERTFVVNLTTTATIHALPINGYNFPPRTTTNTPSSPPTTTSTPAPNTCGTTLPTGVIAGLAVTSFFSLVGLLAMISGALFLWKARLRPRSTASTKQHSENADPIAVPPTSAPLTNPHNASLHNTHHSGTYHPSYYNANGQTYGAVEQNRDMGELDHGRWHQVGELEPISPRHELGHWGAGGMYAGQGVGGTSAR
jgi:hypothetical protein